MAERRAGVLAATRRWLASRRPRRAELRADALAGLPGAISTVPDGMANAVLVGVNPAYGLYAGFAGPIGGGLATSTRLMVVTTTTAAALAAGSALSEVPAAERDRALVLLTVLAGVLMLAAGLARLGRYVRFVSRSVMLGFLSGVAVNILLGQIPDLLGADGGSGLALQKAWEVLTHLNTISVTSAVAGLGALVLLVGLDRTRLAMLASLAAVVVPTVIVVVLDVGGVASVSDIGQIPAGLPPLVLPQLRDLDVALVTGALSVAAIVLVQGAGVAQAAPNPDGSPSRPDQDFVAQGVGNLASGVFHGLPVGGSVGGTAINVSAGARTRWGTIFSGVWMLVILLAFSGLVAYVLMPTLAAVLIVAAIGSLRPTELGAIWRTGTTSKVALLGTFVATLLLPVAAAVGVGVILSLLLQLNKDAMDLRVVELVRREDGALVERPAPAHLPDARPVVLDVYGSLLYAGARTLEARLPDPSGATAPVVVLRLRGRTSLGATFFAVVAGYAEQLGAAGGRLYLSGVDASLVRRFQRTQSEDVRGQVRVFDATEVLGGSTTAALEDAESWLVRRAATPVAEERHHHRPDG